MDWATLGINIAKAGAPILGGMLGGPLGSMIAGGAVDILAKALGVPATPEAVNAAVVTGDPNVIGPQLSAAQAEAQAKWPALAQMAVAQYQANAAESDSINQTMRAELANGQRWYSWRNLYGYSVVVDVGAVSPIFLYSVVMDPAMFTRFISASSWLVTWYTLRFGLLGFIHNGASNEKIAAVTGETPGMVKGIIKAVTGKK